MLGILHTFLVYNILISDGDMMLCVIRLDFVSGREAGGHLDGGHRASHQADEVQEANKVILNK